MQGCLCFGLLFLGPPGWFVIFLIMISPPPPAKRDPLNSFANTFYGKND